MLQSAFQNMKKKNYEKVRPTAMDFSVVLPFSILRIDLLIASILFLGAKRFLRRFLQNIVI